MWCKNHAEQLRADRLASICAGSQDFWRERKTQTGVKVPLPETVGEACGRREVADMWRETYSEVFNSVQDDSGEEEVRAEFERLPPLYDVVITPGHVTSALMMLTPGKAARPDGISAESLLNAPRHLSIVLAILFNALIVNNFLPSSFNSICSEIITSF